MLWLSTYGALSFTFHRKTALEFTEDRAGGEVCVFIFLEWGLALKLRLPWNLVATCHVD